MAEVNVGIPYPIGSQALNSRYAERAISPPLPPVQKGEQMGPLAQFGIAQLLGQVYDRSPAKPWVDKNIVDPALNFIMPPAQASVDPTGGKPLPGFAGVDPSQAIQAPQALSPPAPDVQVAEDVTDTQRAKDYADAANYLEQGGDVPEGYNREDLIKDYRDAAMYLDSGILSLDREEDLEEPMARITPAEEEEGMTALDRPMFDKEKYTKDLSKGETSKALENLAVGMASQIDKNPDLTPEEKEEAKKDAIAFGSNPNNWLLDFGLAMMSCDSPYFMTCVGNAGQVAQKSARERKKTELEQALIDYKMKDLKSKEGGDWESKTMNYLNPITGERETGTVMRGKGKNSGEVRGVQPNGTVFVIDPSTATTLDVKTDVKPEDIALGAGYEKAGARDKIREDLDNRRVATMSLVNSYIDMADAVVTTDGGALGLSGSAAKLLDTARAQASNFKKYIAGFDTDMNKVKLAKGGNQEELISGASILDDEGFWADTGALASANRQFKSAAFEMAYYALASVGQTGKAVSDFELKTMLQAIGADVGSKQQFNASSSAFLRRTLDNYTMRHNTLMERFPDEERFDWRKIDYEKLGGDPRVGEVINSVLGGRRGGPAPQKSTPSTERELKTLQGLSGEKYNAYMYDLLNRNEAEFEAVMRQLKPGISASQIQKLKEGMRSRYSTQTGN